MKTTQGFWTQQYIWHSESYSPERRTFLQKAPSKKPFLGSWSKVVYVFFPAPFQMKKRKTHEQHPQLFPGYHHAAKGVRQNQEPRKKGFERRGFLQNPVSRPRKQNMSKVGPSSTFGTQSATATRGVHFCRSPLLRTPFSWSWENEFGKKVMKEVTEVPEKEIKKRPKRKKGWSNFFCRPLAVHWSQPQWGELLVPGVALLSGFMVQTLGVAPGCALLLIYFGSQTGALALAQEAHQRCLWIVCGQKEVGMITMGKI